MRSFTNFQSLSPALFFAFKLRRIMGFPQKGFISCLMAVAIAIIAFNGTSYAQFSVSISGPSAAIMRAPTAQFNVTATVSATPTKIVFYRNDVPYKTFTGSGTTQALTENLLGQDTYTYRARAYDSQGTWVDSSDFKLTVETPRVFKMGVGLVPVPPLPGSTPPPTTGTNRNHDHTAEIQAAVNYLSGVDGSGLNGGTLYFPCIGVADPGLQSIYNIKNTITIPSNVTLQGESAEENGRCRIYWNDDLSIQPPQGCYDNGGTLLNKPMFKIAGGTSRVRFRDLWLWSRSAGSNCFPRLDWDRIKVEKTVAVALYGNTGHIRDIILENVSISSFTYGIKASTCPNPDADYTYDADDVEVPCQGTDNEISDIKMRGVRPSGNHRQLYINAKYAYDWDVQNFNLSPMLEQQGAVEIRNAGAPISYTGENKKLKFLQLNCVGNPPARTAKFCVRVQKHGGLYFRQLHTEGVNTAIKVEPLPSGTTNNEPIIFEHSVATGEFKDASMKLYLIGNNVFSAPEVAPANLDSGRLRFTGSGVNSTVVDCGDVHWDLTDTFYRLNNTAPPGWADFRMLYTHTERNRSSFFADNNGYSFVKRHTICPSGVPGLPNINEIGGEHFNTGVIPMETFLPYSSPLNCLDQSNCGGTLQNLLDSGTNRGTIYITGSITVNGTITIPSGRQLVGGPGAELVLNTSQDTRLLQINVPLETQTQTRSSGIVIRNLKLRTTQTNKTGLAIIGADHDDPAVSSDMHFSGLNIEGFAKGLEVARYGEGKGHPMVDGFSWKNISFVNNITAASVFSQNLSNWNVMNLSIESNSDGALGWYQRYGGHLTLQSVMCKGTSYPMTHCVKLDVTGTYLTGLKQTQNVTNALTFGENLLVFDPPYQSRDFANVVLRNNDFRSSVSGMSRVNVIGKTFIVSMNNKYSHFNVAPGYEGELSRLTYCGDTYDGGTPYLGLAERHPNLYVGVPTPTRVQCGTRPVSWDDAIRWGGKPGDKPLVGNFFNDVREDFVIYREGSPSRFLIKQAGGTGEYDYQWGMIGDKPLIGRFFPGARAQLVVFRPSNGNWYVTENTINYQIWNWGLSEDIPLIGNFIDESVYDCPGRIPVTGNKDEIAVYRPSTRTFYFNNPRSGCWGYVVRNADYGTNIQVGDFLGIGYDQIAQFDNGVWNIVNPRTQYTYTANLGQTDDVPVAGKYLPGACTQLGVWRPSSQEFIVKDPFTSCGTRQQSMIWGSKNYFGTTDNPDDIPLRINTADGSLHRPTAYRPWLGPGPDLGGGVFKYSISNGLWWVHDPF